MSRRTVFLATLVLCAVTSPLFAEGGGDTIGPHRKLAVYDATGKRVGNVIGLLPNPLASTGPSLVVAFSLNGRTAVVLVGTRAFFPVDGSWGTGTLYFTSANCSGTPFFAGGFSDPGFDPPTFVMGFFPGTSDVPGKQFTISQTDRFSLTTSRQRSTCSPPSASGWNRSR